MVGPSQRRRIEVDISRHEICEPKQARELDGYTIYVYAPPLLVCEKLRAICQQMPEYNVVVKRNPERIAARPRDFLDIYVLLTRYPDIDLTTAEHRTLLEKVFAAKRVPLSFLAKIGDSYEQHHSGWPAVRDTVDQRNFELKDFAFYFDFVVDLAHRLHPVGDM